ncbi:methylmalonyl-CoA mutase [bacterium]|jgi:methylmalonyl-CoA mutase N-terminal domain/subunit|nr:methylmalonyl-CoA mutase [bacterium]MBT3850375.1 methylmalonyl-CoA mutase [bacterium]MBT4634237.1 methylmalonyl-CoA mutase [bacterium]|tara:strand:- start:1808 stop:3433 length:1626 start_codon:yes stop_codon:yes gene_type:complete
MRKKDWEKKYKDKLNERKESFKTTSNIKIERFYTKDDLPDNLDEMNSHPGEFPFTRGVQPTMYRGRFWTMRQYAGFGSAKETNQRFKYLLDKGQTGLSVAFDLPTQMGYDSDAPVSKGEVGKVGVAIDSLEDMEILFDGIPLDKVSTSMTINATASMLLAMYIITAEKQGVSADKIMGTTQNDLLKEFIARGTYAFPPKPSVEITVDVMEYCKDYVPKWNPISVSGYHIREAGSTAVQEISFMLADAIQYLEIAKERKLNVEKICKRVSFFFAVHGNFFEEIAKYRAARRIWAKILREDFNVKDDNACKFRTHSQTGGVTLTAQQPLNNIVRTAMQAMAAVLGGTQSLHTNSFDEALGLPTEESATIALRTQQIIAHECEVANTIDPFAGSYFVENLTDEIEKKVYEYLSIIKEKGGMINCIEENYIQSEIENSAYDFQIELEKKERIIVGVNDFVAEEEEIPPILSIDPELETNQKKSLSEVKARRNNDKAQDCLKKLKLAAENNENIMPNIVSAAREYCTIGEMTKVLEEVHGRYKNSG